jgi:hypothetical protein
MKLSINMKLVRVARVATALDYQVVQEAAASDCLQVEIIEF